MPAKKKRTTEGSRGPKAKPAPPPKRKRKQRKSPIHRPLVSITDTLNPDNSLIPTKLREILEPLRGTQQAFLMAFAACGNISQSARVAGFSADCHYAWLREGKPEYLEAFQVAQREAKDRLQQEAWRRSVEGVRRYRISGGVVVRDPVTGEPLVEHEYSDGLLKTLLTAEIPEKYLPAAVPRPDRNVNVKHGGKVEHEHTHGIVQLGREELEQLPTETLRLLLDLSEKRAARERGETIDAPSPPQPLNAEDKSHGQDDPPS